MNKQNENNYESIEKELEIKKKKREKKKNKKMKVDGAGVKDLEKLKQQKT